MSEKRLEAIELKLSFLDDAIEKLDQAIASQQQQILELKEQNRLLQSRISEMSDDMDSMSTSRGSERPPHY